jgi:hypothetical protein
VRDERGELTGLLQERAAGIVRAAGPRQPTPPEAETIAAYRACFRRYLGRGVTSVHVAGTSLSGAALLERARTEALPLRLCIMLREDSLAEAIRRKVASATNTAVHFGAIKLFHGNSLSGQTCWLSKPYEDRPDYYGVPPARSQEALNQLVLRVHEAGLQACVHSNGDREIEMVLTAFESALRQKPRADHRHRIEHCSVVTEALLGRIKKVGLVIVPHSYIWEHGDKMENYGAWRWDWMHPARALLDLGIPIAGHSDDPVSVSDPLLRVQDNGYAHERGWQSVWRESAHYCGRSAARVDAWGRVRVVRRRSKRLDHCGETCRFCRARRGSNEDLPPCHPKHSGGDDCSGREDGL